MSQVSVRIATLVAGCMMASGAMAGEYAFPAGTQVPTFSDAGCAIPTGVKVDGAKLNGMAQTEGKGGCLALKGEKTSYFVRKPVVQRECRQVAGRTVDTSTAGSAAANKDCVPVIK